MKLYIKYNNNTDRLYKLFEIVSNNQGKQQLYIVVQSDYGDIELKTGFFIDSKVESLCQNLDWVSVGQAGELVTPALAGNKSKK